MRTKKRKLGKMIIEEPLLDAEGQLKQRELNDSVLTEYTEKRSLTSKRLGEEVAQYEKEISHHVID